MFQLDEPYVNSKEINYLTKAIKSGWISSQGPFVKKFEKKFAKYIGVKYAKSCFSGTSALTLLFSTLKLKKNDEVIMQSFNFSADAFALKQSGAKIIFADSAKGQFAICPFDVKKKKKKKKKMIILTHLYGIPADMDPLLDICKKKNIFLIEDCSQAAGSIYKGRMVGSIGDFNIHSFHNKLIASGEGGMVTTNSKILAERFDNLKNPASVNRPEERRNFVEISLNHRMSNLHAAVGLAQLERLEKNIKKKIMMAKIYNKIFKNVSGIKLIINKLPKSRSVYWRYTIFLDPKINIKKFIFEAKKKKIVTRRTYLPLHLHPVFKKKYNYSMLNCENLGKYGLDIPSGVKLKKRHIYFIGKTLKKIAQKLLKKRIDKH